MLILTGMHYLTVNAQGFRAPAYPLISHDTYFSIWSTSDKLTDSPTKHWTGTDQSLTGFIKVDGTAYRFMGNEEKTYKTLIPTSDEENYQTKYAETQPTNGWENVQFNDADWKNGIAPFGDNNIDKTSWKTKDIWVRRTFTLNQPNFKKLYLKISHDDNVEVYLNGEKVYNKTGWVHKFAFIEIDDAIRKNVKAGKNVLAVHCANTAGGAHLDAGLVTEPTESTQKANILVANQTNVDMKATQTIYNFTCGNIDLALTFTSPLLLNDLNLLSRPISYISYKVKSNDSKAHNVQVYFGASTDIAVNTSMQPVTTQKYTYNNVAILKAGTV